MEELRKEGKDLIPYETDIDVGEFEERWISFSPSGLKWFTTILPSEVARGKPLSPLEQVELIFHDYVIGQVMVYGEDRKRLVPDKLFTWEFRTPSVRVFGWLPRRRHFIVVNGQVRSKLKAYKDFEPYINEVASFRSMLNLDEPKYLEGIRANEIC